MAKWEYHLIESSIPALEQMRKFKQWIVRRGKIPHQINGMKAKVSDPSTWHSLDEVLAKADEFDGIGFVFTKRDPYLFIDLDHVLGPGGEVVPAWAKELIAAIDSYTERSPSGDGLHIFVEGSLPKEWRNKVKFDDGSALEVYQNGRYSTVTLDVFNGKDTIKKCDISILGKYLKNKPKKESIEPQNEALTKYLTLDDETIIQRIKERGKWPQSPTEADDWSALDMAFANELAFWCAKDMAQMDRIFRNTPLYRKKWDEKHYADGKTYGEHTLLKAVQDVGDVYNPHYQDDPDPFARDDAADQAEKEKVSPIKRLLQFALTKERAQNMSKIEALIPNFLAKKHHTYLFGNAGSLKSSIAAMMMLELAKNGYQIHYWGFDTNPSFNQALVEIIEDEGLNPVGDYLVLVDATVQDFYEFYKDIIAAKTSLENVVIVIDTYKFIVNGDINDKRANARAMHFIKDLQRLGSTVLSLGHTNKDGKLQSGTAEIEQDSDGIFKIEAITDGDKVQVEIKKAGRVRFAYAKPLIYQTNVATDSDEVLRWKKFLANIRPVDEEIDIEEIKRRKEQEEKDRHLINGIQAILRLYNGRLIQKEILKYLNEDDDYAGYSKQKILPVLNNPHYNGKYWRVKRTGERNHIKEYHLIDTVQIAADRIKERL